MRDRRNGSLSGPHGPRSRSRSPPLLHPPPLSRPRIHFRSFQQEEEEDDEERNATWRNPRIYSYYRSRSPVRTADRRDYRFPGPTSLRRDHRHGDYYYDEAEGVGSVKLKTLASPPRTARNHREGMDRERAEIGAFRVREERSYEEKGPVGLSYRYHENGGMGSGLGRIESGTGRVSVSGEGLGLRGYFEQLVDSRRNYGRGKVVNGGIGGSGGGSGDYLSPPPPGVQTSGIGDGDYVASPSLRTRSGGGDYVVSPNVRASLVDPIIGRSGGGGGGGGGGRGGGRVGSMFRDGMSERWNGEDYGVIQERYTDVGRSTLLMKEHREGGDEVYLKPKMSLDGGQRKLAKEEFGYRAGVSSSGVRGDRVLRLHEPYEGFYASEGRTQGFKEEELGGIGEPSKILMGRKHSLERETGGLNRKSDWYAFEGIDDSMVVDDEDLQPLKFVENLDSIDYSAGRTRRVIDMMGDNDRDVDSNNSLSPMYLQVPEKNHSNKPRKHSKKDKKKHLGVAQNVKQRLGPIGNVKQRLGPIGNVKQRLGPAPNASKTHKIAHKVSRKLPWVENYERRRFIDDVDKIMDDIDGSNDVQEVESSEVEEEKLHKVKTEPPEGSEEFAQMVQSAFLKFSKLLNEKSAYRKKYLEQGASGSFRCSVCGSFSEFSSTLSLAQHAFASCKVGYRSEHLGFHKALCVLMGWKYAEGPNSSWVRQILPASEAALMKEDLIIWPPVVLVHNSSIVKGSVDCRIVVSIEQLKIVLRDMGFGQGIINLCRGKAANLSVMVASFSGTLSGLQEAERLHRYFAGKQHGRAEFKQICSNSCGSSGEAQRMSADDVESVLYGYLGTASDMDVLDFETKKRSVVKSKKVVEAIADTFLVSR